MSTDADSTNGDLPLVIPAIELKGSPAEKLRTLDEAIVRLRHVRRAVMGEPAAGIPPHELRGRYIDAPSWPWFLAGWVFGALFVLVLLVARTYA